MLGREYFLPDRAVGVGVRGERGGFHGDVGAGHERGPVVLVRAVVQLARSLGLRSVGEGVETMLQMERLQSFGCDTAQGYLFGRPQPEPQFEIGPLEPQLPLRPVADLTARWA